MYNSIFDIAIASLTSAFKPNGRIPGILLRALGHFDVVKLRSTLSKGAIEFHAIVSEDITTPFVTLVCSNDLDISCQKTNFTSSINIRIGLCFRAVVIELEWTVNSELTCIWIIAHDCLVLGVCPLVVSWREVKFVTGHPVEILSNNSCIEILVDRPA